MTINVRFVFTSSSSGDCPYGGQDLGTCTLAALPSVGDAITLEDKGKERFYKVSFREFVLCDRASATPLNAGCVGDWVADLDDEAAYTIYLSPAFVEVRGKVSTAKPKKVKELVTA